MSFLHLPIIRVQGVRYPHMAGRCPRRPPRDALQVEGLEDRLVLDTVTFAQFSNIGGLPQVFDYTNNNGTSADFDTVAGGDAILLSVDTRFAPALTSPLAAHLFLTSQTSTAASPPVAPDNTSREPFPVATNTIQVVLDTPVNGETNFLTVTFSGLFSGVLGAPEASLTASDAAGGTPPDTVTFTSDFIDFTGTLNHGVSLSFSSVNSVDGSGGLQLGSGSFFKSFTTAGTGTFDTSFPGQIGGLVFQDSNDNGMRDAGEPGLAGWHVFLNGNGVQEETVTDANGNYSFTDLPPGTYQVTEENRPGWMQTTVSPGPATVLSGSNITGLDFGNFQLGTVSGTVFQDTNDNGVLDAGEPGLAGWTVDLEAVGGSTQLSTVTDASGNYSFSDLPAGTYSIHEVVQAGWMQTTANPPDITVTGGSNFTGIDFGNFQPGTISGMKFEDVNGNGMRDAGELGLEGWTIILDAVGGSTQMSTVTDASGNYSFTGLMAGTYSIQEVSQPGWVETTVNPANITITSGASFTGIDFGNFQLGSVSGRLFLDSKGTGLPDSGEPGLAGWTVNLDAVDGSTQLSTVTDGAGNFSFTGLPAGTYSIQEVGQPGWVQTTANPPDITVTSGSNSTGVDFGNEMVAVMVPVAPALIPGFPITGPPPNPPVMFSKLDLFAPSFAGIPNGLLAADSAYIGALYETLLNRPVDQAGLTHWLDMLLAGMTREQVATAIWQSPEHRSIEVDQFYTTFLGRSADPAGQAYWVNVFLDGASEVDVIRDFVTSPEYQATHASDQAFVNGLYTQILGRLPDAAGQATWLQALQSGGSRAAVAQAFLTSAEVDQRVVDEYYQLFLNRAADPAGEQQWISLLQSGQATLESAGEAFLASDEYFARAATI
jgi:uncharacterized protein (DUF2141 family)